MSIIDSIAAEFDHEAGLSRRLLERVPEEKFDWKPHEKSMTMGRLSSHVAEVPQWLAVVMELDVFELDPAQKSFNTASRSELLESFDDSVKAAKEKMKGVSDEKMMGIWEMKAGGKTIVKMPRVAVLRSFILNHMIHHRGQLSVYLRLNDIPVPSIYGPSADERG